MSLTSTVNHLSTIQTNFMRIISYNTNGIRAAIKKGLLEWLQTNPADIICIQETKASKDDVDVKSIEALGFNTYWFSAQKKGIAVLQYSLK